MAARKSAEVTAAVALVTSGKCKSVHRAAAQHGVAATSVYRDPAYLKWKAAQKAYVEWKDAQKAKAQ